MKKNESGMTLVEVLATLVLLSLVGTLIWTAFFISAKHNITETSKLHLQQEANYILTDIQNEHRYLECYSLEISEDKVELFTCEDTKKLIELVSSNYMYENRSYFEIKPKQKDLELSLVVIDPNNPKLKVEVETTITRYKSE